MTDQADVEIGGHPARRFVVTGTELVVAGVFVVAGDDLFIASVSRPIGGPDDGSAAAMVASFVLTD